MGTDYFWMLAAACLLALDLRYTDKGLWILAIASAGIALLLYSGLVLPVWAQLLTASVIAAALLAVRHWVRKRRQQREREQALGEAVILSVTGDGRAMLLFEGREVPCVALTGELSVGQKVLIQGFGTDVVYCRALKP